MKNNNWQTRYQDKLISLESAVGKLQSGDKIWAGGFLSNPVIFLKCNDPAFWRVFKPLFAFVGIFHLALNNQSHYDFVYSCKNEYSSLPPLRLTDD